MNLCDNKLTESYFKASSYEEILSALMDLMQHRLNLSSIAIYELHKENYRVKISRGFSSFYIKNFSREKKDSTINEIVNSNSIIEIENEKEIVENNPQYSVFFPLIVKKDVMGFIYMGRNKEFEKSEKDFFKNMAIIAAYILRASKLEESSKKLNIFDEMTNAYNINYFYLRLNEALHKLEKMDKPFSLFYIKYRYFMKIKKIYGSSQINESFKKIVETVKNNIRNVDNIFRYHHDGFVVIFENHIEKDEDNIINKLEKELDFVFEKMNIKADIDKALLNIKSKFKLDELINLMEDAIYKSERTGKTVIIEE